MFLKQSTSATITIGPFLDATDGVAEQTGLTVAVELSKNGGAFAARNDGTAIAHDSDGWYSCVLDTTDTNTVGKLIIKSHDSANHLPVWHDFYVIEENIYDAFYSGGSNLNSISDAVLSRGVENVENTADTHSLTKVVLASTEWSASGTGLTIRKTDGTEFLVKQVTTDAEANLIVTVE